MIVDAGREGRSICEFEYGIYFLFITGVESHAAGMLIGDGDLCTKMYHLYPVTLPGVVTTILAFSFYVHVSNEQYTSETLLSFMCDSGAMGGIW